MLQYWWKGSVSTKADDCLCISAVFKPCSNTSPSFLSEVKGQMKSMFAMITRAAMNSKAVFFINIPFAKCLPPFSFSP